MPTQEWVLMAKLVAHMYAKSDAEPFREPVDWKALGLFDYPQIIKRPMDLGQVKRKIETGKYNTIHEAADDMRLIWKNCMQYNADGSDFYILAQGMAKKFEEKMAKLMREVSSSSGGGGSPNNDASAAAGKGEKLAEQPSLEAKRTFAKCLYRISKEDLGKVITELDSKCAIALTKNAAEDEVEINVDHITPAVFEEVMGFVNKCVADNNANGTTGRKKKHAATGGGAAAAAANNKLTKKSRAS